jgi:predicted  nucleic acid-binding Zn-ribbon protein
MTKVNCHFSSQKAEMSSPADDFLVLNGEQFKIDREVMGISCLGFESLPRGYQIKSKVSGPAVVEFIAACNFQGYKTDNDLIFDLLRLAREFNAPQVEEDVLRMISMRKDELLVENLLFAIEQKEDTSELEDRLQKMFPRFVDHARILELPLDLLIRVISFPPPSETDKFSAVFSFCIQLFDNHGGPTSPIFKRFDVNCLTAEQRSLLSARLVPSSQSQPAASPPSASSQPPPSIPKANSANAVSDADFSNFRIEIETLKSNVVNKSDLDSLRTEILSMKSDFVPRSDLVSLRSQLESKQHEIEELKTRLAKVESNFATGSTLNSLRESLRSEFKEERSTIEILKNELTTVQSKNEILTQQVTSLHSQLIIYGEKMKKLPEEFLDPQFSMAKQTELESGLASLRSQIAQVRLSVQADQSKHYASTKGFDNHQTGTRDGMNVGEWNPVHFPFYETTPLEGIIASLTRQCGGNVHEKGVVEVLASSDSDHESPRNIADLKGENEYWSENSPNSWIGYDFKNRLVQIRSYTLRSYWNGMVGGANPRSWVIESSNNKRRWIKIDERDDNNDLNGRNLDRKSVV